MTNGEDRLQLALMLLVGSLAAAASWDHVLHLAHSNGQDGWLSWAVAACTETAAVSGGLEIRRRRRRGKPVTWAVAVVVGATGLQLSAQIAEAPKTSWGIVLAAVPAVTFLALVKLAMSRVQAHQDDVAVEHTTEHTDEHTTTTTPTRDPAEPTETHTTKRRRRRARPRTDEELLDAIRDMGDTPSVRAVTRELKIGTARARRLIEDTPAHT